MVVNTGPVGLYLALFAVASVVFCGVAFVFAAWRHDRQPPPPPGGPVSGWTDRIDRSRHS
jgi:hypothetical protein